jgi:glycosyltransferase involved in cell wall biosynthesis
MPDARFRRIIPLLQYLALLTRRFMRSWQIEGPAAAFRQTAVFFRRRVLPAGQFAPAGPAPAAPSDALMPAWRALARSDAHHLSQPPAVLRKRRQIALIGDLNLPQCRKYRVEQLQAFWAARDVALEYAHFEDVPRATRLLQLATHVIEYRLPATPLTEMLHYEARRLRLPVLYDIDDPLFSVSAYETYSNMAAWDEMRRRDFLRSAPGYLSRMNAADAISVSTPGLASLAAKLSNRPVFLRRNFADAETLARGRDLLMKPRGPDDCFRLSFPSGSLGRSADFSVIRDVIVSFCREHTDCRLEILGHFDLATLPPDLATQTEHIPFAPYDNFLAHLSRADLVLVPLTDDAFNACKSAVRVLDAAAVGVPVMASDVGDLPNVIEDGRTGWLCRAPEDWLARLEECYRNRASLKKMGKAAREDVETRWALSDEARIVSPELLDWVEA